MLKTKPALYRVAGQQNNHFWLEVLEGKDQGIRVSVPIHSTEYTERLQTQVLDLSVDEVKWFELVSDSNKNPNWRVKDILDRREYC